MADNILYLDWPCFGKEDVMETFAEYGFSVIPFFHEEYTERKSAVFDRAFDKAVEGKEFRFCFSFNYYPLVSEGCKRHDIPYVSIVYDSPFVAVFSYTIINPNNVVFLFDYDLYERLYREGIKTVYYLPLPVNPNRLNRTIASGKSAYRDKHYEVSFVGSLYHEDHTFFDRMTDLSDFTRGYLDAVMDAQKKVYGCNFIEQALRPDILAEMQKSVPYGEDKYGVQSLEYVYATYFVDRKITQTERTELLNKVAGCYPLSVFTRDQNAPIPQAKVYGTIDYYKDMPHVFYNSKINLNITLRSITSGIPLRAMDIMGCGGFLLSNFQNDFLRHFVPDEDFAYFESAEDLLQKIGYYLEHDKERAEIAENGKRKAQAISYRNVFDEILALLEERSSCS